MANIGKTTQTSNCRTVRTDSNIEDFSTVRLTVWKRLLPIIFFLTFLNFTVFLFSYGPWDWPVQNPSKLYTFLTLAHLALFIGYLSAAFGKPRGYCGRYSTERLLSISLLLNLLLLLPTSISRSGSAIPQIGAGLVDLGSAYMASNEMRMEAGGGITEYTRILLSPILSLLIPLTFYYWGQLKLRIRLLSIVSILGFLSIYVAIGTNKAIADFVLLVPCLIVSSYCAGRLILRWKYIALVLIATVFGFTIFFSFFSSAIVSRMGSEELAATFPVLNASADLDNFLIKKLPKEVQVGAIALTSYLTQGYYALSLCLEKPFVPMFGVGNSMFLTHNAIKITGIENLGSMTYPARIEEDGWDSYVCWSSIYPWIASDVSFPGTILVIFIIGRLFALSWLDTLKGSNPFAVAVFTQFLIMLFYFSANNQVLQSGEALFGFYGLLIFWFFSRK